MTDPASRYLTPDQTALDLVAGLMAANHAALAFAEVQTGLPGISRIAFGRDPGGIPLTLISGLTAHALALAKNPDCAVMLGEVGGKGDPLTHPRLMIRARAQFARAHERDTLRNHWLKGHPKAALYVDLADFAFVRLHPEQALLNAGFGRAYLIAMGQL